MTNAFRILRVKIYEEFCIKISYFLNYDKHFLLTIIEKYTKYFGISNYFLK